jgi:hypothetical protein
MTEKPVAGKSLQFREKPPWMSEPGAGRLRSHLKFVI